MMIVPIQPVPNQTFQALLNKQSCVFHVYQTAFGLMVDIYLGSVLIVAGVLALNNNKIIRKSLAAIGVPGFSGDFTFFDTQGTADPIYTGLGSRFLFVYLEPADLK